MIVNDELERMWEKAGIAKFKVPYLNFPGGIEENHDNSHSG
jgi:hypothetical protein